MRIPLFRIWYSTTYTTLLIVTLLLLCVSPGDTIYQSIKTKEIQKLFVIGGVYLLTFLIVLLIYSTRIYTNRTVLANIPKGYIPVEEGEIGKGVRKMVVKQLRRSAVLAWDTRPRDVRGETDVDNDGDEDDLLSRPNTADSKKEKHEKEKAQKNKGHHHTDDTTIIHVDAKSPPWGHVAHPGWASPSSTDLPNLHYWSVICELPNLIEAKAVSLAPPDPAIDQGALQYPDNAPPLPDAQIVTLLQRPRAMGLREYFARLAEFGLLNPPNLGLTFLSQYEHARYSTASLTEPEFRLIMSTFASILNGMTALSPSLIDAMRAQDTYSDTHSLSSSLSRTPTSSSSSPSNAYRTPQPPRHRPASLYSDTASLSPSTSSSDATHSARSLRTAPSRQRQRSAAFATPRTPSERSLRSVSDTGSVMIHSVQRSASTILPMSSTESFSDAGSVIRLRDGAGAGQLPYEYHIPQLQQGRLDGG